MAYGRRGSAVNAGRKCPFKTGTHACTQYARYEITHVPNVMTSVDTQIALERDTIACGGHLGMAIRDTWRDHKAAAVIQEIPGMWR